MLSMVHPFILAAVVFLLPYYFLMLRQYSSRINLRSVSLLAFLLGICYATGALPSSFLSSTAWLGFVALGIVVLPLIFILSFILMRRNTAQTQQDQVEQGK